MDPIRFLFLIKKILLRIDIHICIYMMTWFRLYIQNRSNNEKQNNTRVNTEQGVKSQKKNL